jgi:hypothetical protein
VAVIVNNPPRSYLPAAPLIDAAIAGRPLWDDRLQCGVTKNDIAESLGVTVNTFNTWKSSGRVPLEKADDAAIACGSHPVLVWSDFYAVETAHARKMVEHREACRVSQLARQSTYRKARRRKYRYRLWRSWEGGRRLGWVMLNPSTADANIDDQTVKRCCHYARRDGFGGIEVANLFAWRATQPSDLPHDYETAFGPENGRALDDLFRRCSAVAVGWGATLRPLIAKRRAWPFLTDILEGVAIRATSTSSELRCLGFTADGSPRHPSRLGNDDPFVTFAPASFPGGAR